MEKRIGYKLVLYTRESTKLSKSLQKLIDDGTILLKKMDNKKLLEEVTKISK